MKKESLKNIVLVLLVLSSVVLTFNIWTDEKLWPDGYNFFSNIAKFLPFQQEDSAAGSLSKEKLALPKKLVVNNAAARSLYFETSEEYDRLIGDVKDIFVQALETDNAVTASNDDWTAALRARSIYVSYPVLYDISVASDILGVREVSLDVSKVKDFIISLGDTVSSNLSVYIKDYDSGTVLRCPVKYDKQAFESLLNVYATESTGVLPYSFELNFDKRTPDAPLQKVTIDPDVLITINKTVLSSLRYENPLYDAQTDEYQQERLNTILKKFGYNMSTVRKYSETDGSIVFVENYGTIKVSPDGLVEYRAITNDRGVQLDAAGSDSFNKIFTAALNFVADMWNDALPEYEINLGLSSDIVNTRTDRFTLRMNYYSDGTLIWDSAAASAYGVEMEIVDAKIVSYRQLFRLYEKDGQTIENMSTIEALDIVRGENLFENTDSIREVYPAYAFDNGECYATWMVKNQDGKSALLRR